MSRDYKMSDIQQLGNLKEKQLERLNSQVKCAWRSERSPIVRPVIIRTMMITGKNYPRDTHEDRIDYCYDAGVVQSLKHNYGKFSTEKVKEDDWKIKTTYKIKWARNIFTDWETGSCPDKYGGKINL